jgi:hypothetical protein
VENLQHFCCNGYDSFHWNCYNEFPLEWQRNVDMVRMVCEGDAPNDA